MQALDWDTLEQAVNALIQRCQQLADENARLRQHRTVLEHRQAELQAAQAHAYQKVTSIIKRLQAIEGEQTT